MVIHRNFTFCISPPQRTETETVDLVSRAATYGIKIVEIVTGVEPGRACPLPLGIWT